MREELERRDLDPLARVGAPPRLAARTRRAARTAASPGSSAGLEPLRAAKERLGGTVNDCVLTAVAGALGRYLRGARRGHRRARAARARAARRRERRRLLATYAPLPVGIEDPRRRHAEISRALDGLRASGRAAGGRASCSALDGFAPPSMIGAAARLQAPPARLQRRRSTNVPGPAGAAHLLGRGCARSTRRSRSRRGQALSVAVVSYAGRLCFGLLADGDALADLELLGRLPRAQALAELERGRATASSPPRRSIIGGWPPLRLALCQLNPTVGDIAANEARDRRRARRARASAGAGLALFGELAVTGYPPEDLLYKEHFLRDARAAVERLAGADARARSRSSASPSAAPTSTTPPRCSPTGAWPAIYRKVHLPNYGVFDEQRYFQAGSGRRA